MNKLNTYRDKDTPDLEERDNDERTWWDGYRESFDAAIKLELPVLFSGWKDSPDYKKWLNITLFKLEDIVRKTAYQYWIDNVFDPEK